MVVFILLMLIADEVMGLILRKLYFNQIRGQGNSLNYVFSECKDDILIIGNSRAQHHYDPQIGTALKMSCYNAGQDGGHSILLSYAQIRILTERYSPKIIILEFNPTGIVHFDGFDRLSKLPALLSGITIRNMRSFVQLRGPFEKCKLDRQAFILQF